MPSEQTREKSIFLSAAEILDPQARADYVREACQGNTELVKAVEALLNAHEKPENLLDGGAPRMEQTLAYTEPREMVGTLVGPYKLLQKLGEGGMGTVWVAEQEQPVKRRVALKLVKAGMDSAQVIRRFEAERQALAMMDHTNIAKVLDAGTTANGRPYFVMELVKGVPITKYCDEVHASIENRLDLFVQVCSAVQHAHQKGIIHRDIKPSNVLIAMQDGKPVPKVIDFGVAKALHSKLADNTMYTEIGQIIGTLEYMAPEQAELSAMDIDTRADIYALGVLLYELLTGSTPITRERMKSAAFAEVLRLIKEEEPQKPSTRLSESKESLATLAVLRKTDPKHLSSELKGELDWVVLKALEKDRTCRYETANGLARDIQRYLDNEVVEARPPNTGYRLRKFVRRNKGKVIAASLVLFVLLLGVAGTTFGLLRAEQRRAEADQARTEEVRQRALAEEAEAATLASFRASTNDAIEQLIGSKNELGHKEKAYLESTLKRWKEFADRKGDDQRSRAIRGEGHYRVGLLWDKLGRISESQAEYQKALMERTKLVSDFPGNAVYLNDLATSYHNLGVLLKSIDKEGEAEQHYRKALAIREKLVKDFPIIAKYQHDLASTYSNLANVSKVNAKQPVYDELSQKALAIREKLVANSPTEPEFRIALAEVLNNCAVTLNEQGKRDKARALYQKVLSIKGQLVMDYPDNIEYRQSEALCHYNLGVLHSEIRQIAEAEEHFGKAVAIYEKLAAEFPTLPDNRYMLAACHNYLGNLFADLGRRPEAEEHYSKALAFYTKLAVDFPKVPKYRREMASMHNNLGIFLAEQGKKTEAEDQYRKALAIAGKLAHEHPEIPKYQIELARSHNNLGTLYAENETQEKRQKAEDHLRQTLAIRKKLADDYPRVPDYRLMLSSSHKVLGNLLLRHNTMTEAATCYRNALDIVEKLNADFPNEPLYQIELGSGHCNFGSFQALSGHLKESLTSFAKAIAILEPLYQRDHGEQSTRQFLLNSYNNRADVYNQLRQYHEAIKDWDKAIALATPEIQLILRAERANSYVRAGRAPEAIAEVIEFAKHQWPADRWYDFAVVYALASGKVADKKQEYLDRAIELLQKTVKIGWKDAAHFESNPDLQVLRQREDYRKLLTEMRKPAEKDSPKPAEKK